MRVLATWDPQALCALHVARDLEESAELGLLPGINASGWFATSWDQRDDFDSTLELDDGPMRETTRGIEARRHPEAMLRDTPRLWDVVSMWRCGVSHDLTREDYESSTNFDLECWLTMVSAHRRETDRRYKARKED